MEIQEIAVQLETIYEQIKKYPTPIAGCDEQFNFYSQNETDFGVYLPPDYNNRLQWNRTLR